MRQVSGYSLWLGNVGDARDARSLFAAGISAAVDLAINELPTVLPRELIHCRFPLVDGAGNPPWLLRAAVQTVATLIRAEIPTLVYCGAGMSRTPAVVAAAIAATGKLSMSDALALVCDSGAADVSPSLWAEVQAVVK